MADQKISELTGLSTSTPLADTDLLAVIDVSDTSMAASGSTRKITSKLAFHKLATKTVATASSGERADYYTDGTADDVEIQAAIDAVGATGGTVFIKAGAYTLSTGLTCNYGNIRIMGEGAATALTISNASNITGISVSDSLTVGYSNITFQDFSFDGNKANQTGDNITPGTSFGLVIYGSSYCTFKNLIFNNWANVAIFIGGNSPGRIGHHRVVNCEANSNYFDGIELNFCHYNLVEGCVTQGNGHGGLYDKGGSHNIFVGNDSSLNTYSLGVGGVGLIADTTTNGIYSNNNCEGNYASGMSLATVDQAVITGNQSNTNGFDGIRCDGVKRSIISNNVTNANGQFGGSSRHGINLFKSSSTFDPTFNIVSGNQSGNPTGTSQLYGIREQNTADSNTITSNNLFTNATANLTTIGASTVSANNMTS